MVIQYCRLSSVYREIFSCANVPTKVSVIYLTPERPYGWGAPIAHSNTQSGGCMWPCTALQGTSNSSDLHTQKRRSRLWQITVFTWSRSLESHCYFTETRGMLVFQTLLYLQIHARICTSLLFHCLCSVAQIWASESLALSAFGSASRVIPTPPTISQLAVYIPLSEKREFAAPPEDQLSDV